MTTFESAARLGHRLLQLGFVLFLFGLIVGIAVPRFAIPRLGLSTHLLGITQGLFLAILGILWPRLALGARALRVGFGLAVYGCVSALTANFLGAVWGAGGTLLPIAAGQVRGSAVREMVIVLGLRTGGAALLATTVLVLWGLRHMKPTGHDDR